MTIDVPRLDGAAAELHASIADAPILSPHTHVDASLFADPDARFDDPARLLVTPDHYLLRMLYSQGVALESLGVPRTDGGAVETDGRRIWRSFVEHFHLFRGTPSALWFRHQLAGVFGITDTVTPDVADDLYDRIDEQLRSPDFGPRQLYDRFGIEVLCTTDAATDALDDHRRVANSGWRGRVIPTFRPDSLLAIATSEWRGQVEALSRSSGIDVIDFSSFVVALEQRRQEFAQLGAVATDHGVETPYTEVLSDREATTIFARALKGAVAADDAVRFGGHMLCEMARMSCEDGLVMQLHAGVTRDHNPLVHERYGANAGADIPLRAEYTDNLRALLTAYGNDARLRLVVFTLDESTYTRELAPLAGHYPALRLGPPWWFHDSWNGIRRYFDSVIETAGLYNTAGFNDDARAFCSIPARHDLWRRASARWVGRLLAEHIVDEDDAREMMLDLTCRLAADTYRLGAQR